MSTDDDDETPAKVIAQYLDDPNVATRDKLVVLLKSDLAVREEWIEQVSLEELLQQYYRGETASEMLAQWVTLDQPKPARLRQRGRRWVWYVAASAATLSVPLCLLLALLLLPAVQSSRDVASEVHARVQLETIGVALGGHVEAHGAFPAAYSTTAKGRALLSWRVQLLPYLGEEELYRKFRLDEPWNSEHNAALIPEMPAVYHHHGDRAGWTRYVAVPLADGILPPPLPDQYSKHQPLGVKLQAVTKGTSKVIMVLEVPSELSVEWTKPVDYQLDPAGRPTPQPILARNVLFADGSTVRLDRDIEESDFTISYAARQ